MQTSDVSKYDQAWSTQWNDMKKYGPFARHLRRIIFNLLSPLDFQSVLDVGCGQGDLLLDLRQAYPKMALTGLDFSASAVEHARQRVQGGNFYVMDLTKEVIANDFDLVICSEVLEHIPEDELALRNLRRMAKKYLVVSSPQGRMRRFEAKYGHVRNYQPGELSAKLRACGFVPLKVIEWGFPFYSPLYRNFLDLIQARGTEGRYGPAQKIIAQMIYLLFALNSIQRGDEIVILAQAQQTQA